jgi:hypothetical protein
VLPGGTWGVSATTLSTGVHEVVATITDAAQNIGSAAQTLTIGPAPSPGDVTAPSLAIDGGSTRSTTDLTPSITGTTDEAGGSTVKVTVGGQTLHATVGTGGVWGVVPSALSAGPHLVVASISDAAHNTRTTTQVITIGQVAGPGDPPETYQPDAAIRVNKDWVGVGVVGGSDQQVTQRLRRRARSTTFEVRVTNTGTSVDAMEVSGTTKNRRFTVTYLVGGRDVTTAVVAGTYRTAPLKHGESVTLVVKVSVTKRAHPGSTRTLELRAVSAHRQSAADVVSAVVQVRR